MWGELNSKLRTGRKEDSPTKKEVFTIFVLSKHVCDTSMRLTFFLTSNLLLFANPLRFPDSLPNL